MMRLIPLILVIATLSCTQPEKNTSYDVDSTETVTINIPAKVRDMNIYEVNIRQYTPEGTFDAFREHLPRLRKMGVDILWLMPIQPISEKNRKGSLGSYYAVADYTGFNPEFGTAQDFRELIDMAHDLGFMVILDWVPNHTGWDHHWLSEHPDYYTHDSLGNVISPNPDWSDVADLNYDNSEMRQEMISALKWWIDEFDIDGYRMDVAWGVPVDFWVQATDSLDKVKEMFMLAEAEDPALHTSGAFDMSYGWEFHHLLNAAARGEANALTFHSFMKDHGEKFPEDAIKMNFTTNHDENSWAGTVFERFGEGHLAYAVIAFTAHGMPLIYSGQEAGLDKRLRFFEKDTIDFSTIPYADFYGSLLQLKKESPALHHGFYGGEYVPVPLSNENVLAYTRAADNNRVTVLVNLSDENQLVRADHEFIYGTRTNYLSGEQVNFPMGENIEMAPYAYYIFSEDVEN